jgi:hypothetical protein
VATASAVATVIAAVAVVALGSHATSRAGTSSTVNQGTRPVAVPGAGAARASVTSDATGAIQPGWPGAVAGFTVALASDRSEADARRAADQAAHRGLPSVGFLWSSEYRSLRPGYWFVFSGVYTSATEAAEHVAPATAAGFAGAYPRRVAR